MPQANVPTAHELESSPRCCPRCFADRGVKAYIGRYGVPGENCGFCESSAVRTIGVQALIRRLEPLFEGYVTAEAGTHYIPELADADGSPLDELLDEDNPDLFSPHLDPDARQALVQALLDAMDAELIAEGHAGRDVSDFWVRPGEELWAGAEDERSFETAPQRWQRFVWEVSHESRYFRRDPDVDPQTYLTAALLKSLSRRLPTDERIFRAVIGGEPLDDDGLAPLPPKRMAGPDREHSKEGLRVNAAGMPVLYAAKDAATAVAEVRPWVGAPVSVATLRVSRPIRLIDFSPRRRSKKASVAKSLDSANAVSREELDDILTTIGAAMARPIDPSDSQVGYLPTQYVAEVVRRAGYDGVMFKSAVGRGTNVVLFDKNHAKVESVELRRVTGLKYSADVVPSPSSPPTQPDASDLVGSDEADETLEWS